VTRTEVTEIIETVYTNNARKLINWALKRLLSVEDAEELCQETMFLLYKKIIQVKKEINGVSPMIVIPHKYDGNDNEDSISKVIDFILSSYSEHVKVDELECHGVGISGKIINIIQKNKRGE